MDLREKVLEKLFGAVETDKRNIIPYHSYHTRAIYVGGKQMREMKFYLSIAVTFVTETGKESKPFVNFTVWSNVTLTPEQTINQALYRDEELISTLTQSLFERSKGLVNPEIKKYQKKSKREIHSVYITHSSGASTVMKINKELLGLGE